MKKHFEYVGFNEAISELGQCYQGRFVIEHQDRAISWNSYREINDLDKAIEDCKKDRWKSCRILWQIYYCGYSDYSNMGLIGKSNYQAFLEITSHPEAVVEMSYGWNGSTLAVDPRFINRDQLSAIFSLENYPSLDDELLSTMEVEEQNSAWELTYRSDFVSGLTKIIDTLIIETDDPELYPPYCEEDYVETIGDDQLWEMFNKARESANEYWSHDSYCSVEIDLDRVLGSVDSDLLWNQFSIWFEQQK